MKNITKGLTLLLLSSVLLFACSDETTTPTATAPSNLKYDPSTIMTDEGVSVESSIPTIDGTAPITYAISTVPDAGIDISVDATTGIISTTGATAGTYAVTVTATNEAGSTEFKDALTVDVIAKITYKGHIQGVFATSCAPCHVTGGPQTQYGVSYALAKGGVDFILNRVNRMQGSAGFMPQGGTALDSATLDLIARWKSDGLLEE